MTQIQDLNANRENLTALIAILDLFRKPMLFFQKEECATIHKVWVTVAKIRVELQRITTAATSSKFSRGVAMSARKVLQVKLDQGHIFLKFKLSKYNDSGLITLYHKAAVLLDPTNKLAHGVNSETKSQVL